MFKITNRNDFDFTGRFDGVNFCFPKGKTVSCEDEPTMFIFGIGEKDKSPVLSRNGWASPGVPLADGMKVLNKFSFERIQEKLDAPLAREGHGPAPVVKDAPTDKGAADDAPESAGVVNEALIKKVLDGKPIGYDRVFQ
jgi:hypothetical protein